MSGNHSAYHYSKSLRRCEINHKDMDVWFVVDDINMWHWRGVLSVSEIDAPAGRIEP